MKNLFKLLDMGERCADETCANPTKDNWNKLERITKMTQDELVKDAELLLDKYPTEENQKLFNRIMNVYRNGVKRNKYTYR